MKNLLICAELLYDEKHIIKLNASDLVAQEVSLNAHGIQFVLLIKYQTYM